MSGDLEVAGAVPRGPEAANPPDNAVIQSALEAVRAADRAGLCAGVLEITAVLSAGGVGRELLHAAGLTGALVRGRRVGAGEVDQALAELAERSLLIVSPESQSIVMPGPVADAVRAGLADPVAVCWATAAMLEARADVLAESPDPAAVLALSEQVSALQRSAGPALQADERLFAAMLRLRFWVLYQLIELGDSVPQAIAAGEPLTAELEQVLGPDHPDTLNAQNSLAAAYQAAGRPADAIPLFEQILVTRQRVLGPKHPDTLISQNNLAATYQDAGRFAEAILMFKLTLAAREMLLGTDHPSTLNSRANLAAAYRATGQVSEAIPLLERTVTARERVLGADHPDVRAARDNLAAARQETDQTDATMRFILLAGSPPAVAGEQAAEQEAARRPVPGPAEPSAVLWPDDVTLEPIPAPPAAPAEEPPDAPATVALPALAQAAAPGDQPPVEPAPASGPDPEPEAPQPEARQDAAAPPVEETSAEETSAEELSTVSVIEQIRPGEPPAPVAEEPPEQPLDAPPAEEPAPAPPAEEPAAAPAGRWSEPPRGRQARRWRRWRDHGDKPAPPASPHLSEPLPPADEPPVDEPPAAPVAEQASAEEPAATLADEPPAATAAQEPSAAPADVEGPAAEPNAETDDQAPPEPAPGPGSEPEPEPESAAKPEPEPEPESAAEPEPEPAPEERPDAPAPAPPAPVAEELPADERPDEPPDEQPAPPGVRPSSPAGGHPARRRRRVLTLVAAIVIVFAGGGVAGLLTRPHAGHHRPPATGGASSQPLSAASQLAAVWVAQQVARNAIVACDPLMCSALVAQGVLPANLLVLRGENASPLSAQVVVVTAAVRSEFGSRVSSVYAPSVIAGFGSGASEVSVQVVAPDGPTAYLTAQQQDAANRKTAGAQLLANKHILASAQARAQLAAGAVDSRLLLMLPALAAVHPVQILAFNPAPGAGPGVPMCSADLSGSGQAANMTDTNYLRWLTSFVGTQLVPFAGTMSVLHEASQPVVRVVFAQPAPLGLLSSA